MLLMLQQAMQHQTRHHSHQHPSSSSSSVIRQRHQCQVGLHWLLPLQAAALSVWVIHQTHQCRHMSAVTIPAALARPTHQAVSAHLACCCAAVQQRHPATMSLRNRECGRRVRWPRCTRTALSQLLRAAWQELLRVEDLMPTRRLRQRMQVLAAL